LKHFQTDAINTQKGIDTTVLPVRIDRGKR